MYNHLSDGAPGCCSQCGVYAALYSLSVGSLDLLRVCGGCFQQIVETYANTIRRNNRRKKTKVYDWKNEGF